MTNTILGYVRNTFDGQNSMTYGALEDALNVQIMWAGNDCDNPADLALSMLNGPEPANLYLGFVGGSGGYEFKTGYLGYTYMAATSDSRSPMTSRKAELTPSSWA